MRHDHTWHLVDVNVDVVDTATHDGVRPVLVTGETTLTWACACGARLLEAKRHSPLAEAETYGAGTIRLW